MKKLAAMMTIALAAASAGMSVSAAEAMSVWIDANKAVAEDGTLKVSVQSNGEITDGLIEITYDSDVLSIEESDIVPDEQVAMYSVNLEEDTVKIAYLAENAMEQGDFMTLNFKMSSETKLEDAAKALETLTGTNYKEDGTTVSESEIGIVQLNSGDGKDDGKDDSGKDDGKDDSGKDDEKDDSGKDDKDDSSDNGKEDNKNDSSNSNSSNKNDGNNSNSSGNSDNKTNTGSGNQNGTSENKTTTTGTSAKTGDNSQILIPAVLAAAAAGVFAVVGFKKKGEGKNEI